MALNHVLKVFMKNPWLIQTPFVPTLIRLQDASSLDVLTIAVRLMSVRHLCQFI